jgi:RNA recognition motif-containing protein
MAKLFIVGFPRDYQQIALLELFSIHGTVNTVTLITDKETGQPKGYGFITMNDEAGARRAIAALNGMTIEGRTVSVRIADDKPERTPRPASQQRNKRPRRN